MGIISIFQKERKFMVWFRILLISKDFPSNKMYIIMEYTV